MVVVRESPGVHLSPEKNQSQWPPKSPFQALISSPSGRKKWQDHNERGNERSLSPSPMRKTLTSSRALQMLSQPSEDEDMDDEDEDEEIAQLRLAEIQAKLKIKELRQKKAKRAARGDGKENGAEPVKLARPDVAQPAEVQVPFSPVKERIDPTKHMSPARAKLGLSGTTRAVDVSLKRAKDDIQPYRTNSLKAKSIPLPDPPRQSFSERLTASRNEAIHQEAKYERIQKARSSGFGSLKSTSERQASSRTSAVYDTHQSRLHSATVTSTQSRPRSPAKVPASKPLAQGRHSESPTRTANVQDQADTSSPQYDPFSELHLKKRHLSHVDVAREMKGREIYTLPRLLKEVKSPHYDPPDCEEDFVVFAILAAKSNPHDQKPAHRTSDDNKPQEDADGPRNKFMVLKLCDLKWEVDCFLFGTAFDQFWKLTPGTLLAILNPGIMPPKTNQNNGRFSLKLGSSEDSVMEIGVARDLDYCASVKADGKQCSEWVDKRSTEICDFHLNLLIDKQRKGRMEVNNANRTGGEPGTRTKSTNLGERGWDKRNKIQQNGKAQNEYGRLYTVPSGLNKSVTNLLDADDTDSLQSKAEAEASRKRIAAAQKERDLARRLAEMGNGMGAEYLRNTKGSMTSRTSQSSLTEYDDRNPQAFFEKPKAADLGLLDNKASSIRLSPAKDRKKHFGLGFSDTTTTAGGSKAMGWGGAKKPGLLPSYKRPHAVSGPASANGQQQMAIPSGTRPRSNLVRDRSREGSLSPKKKARFMLEKGIREPGRESMTNADSGFDDNDDDDDLDIV